jgi:hypothetical protein
MLPRSKFLQTHYPFLDLRGVKGITIKNVPYIDFKHMIKKAK